MFSCSVVQLPLRVIARGEAIRRLEVMELGGRRYEVGGMKYEV